MQFKCSTLNDCQWSQAHAKSKVGVYHSYWMLCGAYSLCTHDIIVGPVRKSQSKYLVHNRGNYALVLLTITLLFNFLQLRKKKNDQANLVHT